MVAYPTINFTVVVNPASGPGPNSCPDDNYIAAIAQLNRYRNVRKIGYVASTFGNRDPREYQADISKYAKWNMVTCKKDIHLDGIFVDETEATYTTTNQAYYKNFTDYVRTTMPSGKSYIMLNPGQPMAKPFFDYADSIITFEGYYSHMYDQGTIFNDSGVYQDTPKQKQAALIHSFTGNADDQQQVSDNMGETEKMGLLFITDDQYEPNPYDSFPTMWQQFVDAVNSTDTWMAQNPSFFPSE